MSARLRHTSAHEQPSWRRHGKSSCPCGLVSELIWSAALVGWARMGHGQKGLWTGADLGPAQPSQLLRAVSGSGDRAKGDSRSARPIHPSSHNGGAQRSDLVSHNLECAAASTDPDEQKRRGSSGVGFHRHAPCIRGIPFNRCARGPWLGPGREGNLVAVSGAVQVRARVGAQERPARLVTRRDTHRVHPRVRQ